MNSDNAYLSKEFLRNLILRIGEHSGKQRRLLKMVEEYTGDELGMLYFTIFRNINPDKLAISLLEQKDFFTISGILLQGLRAEKNKDAKRFFKDKDKVLLIKFILESYKKDIVFYELVKDLVSLLSVIPDDAHKIILDVFVCIFKDLYSIGLSKTEDVLSVLCSYREGESPFRYHCEAFFNEHLRAIDTVVVMYILGSRFLPEVFVEPKFIKDPDNISN